MKNYYNWLACSLFLIGGNANAFTFELGEVQGNFDSTVQLGAAVRANDPSCSRVGDPSVCAGADVGGWSNGDNGNLNYRKGDLFSEYIKGNHELLLKFGDGWKFLGRATWLLDPGADNTARTDLSSDAKDAIVRDARILDFWLGKSFSLGENQARIRFGNQVLNWGESLFLPGGINATNAIDIQRLSQPGTQLKEVTLPAPMISFATGIGANFNIEAYYQLGWNKDRFAPVGGYWSVADILDKGSQPLYLDNNNFNIGGLDPAAAQKTGGTTGFALTRANDIKPSDNGQFGVSLRYQPSNTNLNLGLYALNYHDKSPNLSYITDANGNAQYQWAYLADRKLYGMSANFPLGDWAIGWELAYRPKDAVALSGCYGQGGALDANTNGAVTSNCQAYIDQKRFDMHLTGLLSLTPGDYGGILKALGNASTATLLAEADFINYPDLQNQYNRTTSDGVAVMQAPQAGYWTRTANDPTLGRIGTEAGSKNSWGYNFDFSWAYDGNVIPGWQVIPEIYYFHAVSGHTPNFVANFAEGAQSANFIVSLVKNPATWQAAVNYATFWGGKDSFDQPLGDRDFFGVNVSRNF